MKTKNGLKDQQCSEVKIITKQFNSSSIPTVRLIILLCILVSSIVPAAMAADQGHNITLKNYCTQTIWVGQFGQITDGWEMASNTTVVKNVPVGFSGRWWPRTGCHFDASSGKCPTEGVDCCDSGGCVTSDPKYFGLVCAQTGQPPVSIFEPTFDAASGNGPIDYLDLSMVDGFSVPMQMSPDAGYNTIPDPGMDPKFWCQPKGWVTNPTCPAELWDAATNLCWGPCKYYTTKKKVTEGTNKANICCDNTNVDFPPTPSKTCEHNDFIGGFGCSPYASGYDDERCYAKDPGKHGYWGDIVDLAWPGISTTSLQYITNVNTGAPGNYAWQFDDFSSTFNCRKTGGTVDYTITFCPKAATYTLNISKSGAGKGTVISDPVGINCGSTCSISFDSDTKVTLTATAQDASSTFSGWSGGASCATSPTCTVVMDAAKTITAVFNSVGGNVQTFPFYSGWNLISLPLQSADMSIAKILNDISDNYTIVWEFTPPSIWKSYDPNDPVFSDLKTFTNDKGYWVKMKAEKSLTVSGTDPSKTISLALGWNLIGYPWTSENAVGTALQTIAGKYTIVWEFTPPSIWKSYDPNDPTFSDLKNLIPGKGYWIKMNVAHP